MHLYLSDILGYDLFVLLMVISYIETSKNFHGVADGSGLGSVCGRLVCKSSIFLTSD